MGYIHVVEQRKDGRVFLASINGNHHFWMSESSDDHWENLMLELLLSTELSCNDARI